MRRCGQTAMTVTRPNFLAVFVAAYWDLGRVLRMLWAPALLTLLLFVLVQFGATFVVSLFARSYVAKMILLYLVGLGSLAVFAPFLVAAHRLISRGEVATISDAATVTPRVALFAHWLLALSFIALLPSLIAVAAQQTDPVYYVVRPQLATTGAPRELALFALTIAAYIFVARATILLAAAANDAPNVGITSALADTRGNGTYIVFATFLCGIPLVAAVMLSFLIVSFLPWKAQAVAIYFVLTATAFFGVTLGACIAARIYQAMGKELNGPAQS
jgi:hypothetical protein